MATIEQGQGQPWSNYHLNIAHTAKIAAYASAGSESGLPGPARFAATAAAVRSLIGGLGDEAGRLLTLGSGWSLSSLLDIGDVQFDPAAFCAVSPVFPGDLVPHPAVPADRLAYASGGAKIWQLSEFAEARDRAIFTCGSYMGQSMAGSIATGVNGSRLGYGAIQNMIRGLHFVTAPDRSVYVEPASRPVLSDAAALVFADEVIRDDAIFDGCLVHLGGMGVVNGLVVELDVKRLFAVQRVRHQVDRNWLDQISRGDFEAVATALGGRDAPAYYEVQVDPYDPWGSKALHSLYYDVEALEAGLASIEIEPSLDIIARIINHVPDLFAVYASPLFFKETARGLPEGAVSWGTIHGKPPSTILKARIRTAAIALDRRMMIDTLPVMCQAMSDGLAREPLLHRRRHLLYTLRFVTAAAGAMAFTRFADTAVVDMEGFMDSPWSRDASAWTRDSLAGRFDYVPHWGKLDTGDAGLVRRQFGDAADPASAAGRWTAARGRLVPADARHLFASPALRAWGLV
ncbi:hypothetical protein ACFO0A_07705 [Novosphingobium tardum]|uniref:FAD/FMN-containing dehydrogenase n=1 Tax=Novosphingobium tardum TaxID=1538021 RepID=A0ABV8RRT7_9SPHN